MYDEYLKKLEEAGKIRNLKERSISCYRNYVAYFLNYVGKDPKDLTCQDVRDFLLSKKESIALDEFTDKQECIESHNTVADKAGDVVPLRTIFPIEENLPPER